MKFSAFAVAALLLSAGPAAASSTDFPPDVTRVNDDWGPNFDVARVITSPAAKVDPVDERLLLSGFGNITVTNTSQFMFTTSSETSSSTKQIIAIDPVSEDGWYRLAQQIYFYLDDYGTNALPNAGLNLVGPSNYCRTGSQTTEDDRCDAAAYFMYGVHETGQVCINKRYEWPNTVAEPICSPVPGFENGIPLNKLIGYKLVTFPRDNGDVRIAVYVNVPADGKGWIRVIDHLDEPGTWTATKAISLTCQSKVTDGQTFSTPGRCGAFLGVGNSIQRFQDNGNLRNLFQAIGEGPTLPPTISPTPMPSHSPTGQPTLQQSPVPSQFPSQSPTDNPTNNPTTAPSETTSVAQSTTPSTDPSSMPSLQPSPGPSEAPTEAVTQPPTAGTNAPTEAVTQPPTADTNGPTEAVTQPPTEAVTQPPTDGADATEAPTSGPTDDNAAAWVDYSILFQDPPTFSFGDGGDYAKLDFIIGVPYYNITVYDRTCKGPSVNDFFNVTDSLSPRSDDDGYDLAVTLNMIDRTRQNPLLFNDTDSDNVLYQACVSVDALRGHDGEPQLNSKKPFGVTVEVGTNKFTFVTDVAQGGNAGDSDHTFSLNSEVDAYFCHEDGTIVSGAVFPSGTGHHFCLKPTLDGQPIQDVTDLLLEKAGVPDPFLAIQDGIADEMVRKNRLPDSNTWIIQLMIPPRFFAAAGSLVISGETSSASSGGGRRRRLQIVSNESDGSFGATVTTGMRMNGVVQVVSKVTLTVTNIAIPQDQESRQKIATVMDAAIHRILRDEAFAKTFSVGGMAIPMLQQPLRRLLRKGNVEVAFLASQFVDCTDAMCTNADAKVAVTMMEATLGIIRRAINDGTLSDGLVDAADDYNVDGFETAEVATTSMSVDMSGQPEIFDASFDSVNQDDSPEFSWKNRGPVAAVLAAVAAVGMAFLYFVNRNGRGSGKRSDEASINRAANFVV